MRYFDGSLNFASTDVSGQAFGQSWSHTRTYGNRATAFSALGHGPGWFIRDRFARLYGSSLGVLKVVFDRQNVFFFRKEEDSIRYLFGRDEYFWFGSFPSDITVADRKGNRWVFTAEGRLVETRRLDGSASSLTYDVEGNLATFSETKGAITGTFSYTWVTLPSSTMKRLGTVTLSIGGAAVERARYTYHDGTTSQGAKGLLKGVVQERPPASGTDWIQVGESYHTYYEDSDPAPRTLRFVLESEAMARLRAAHPDPATWTNSQFAQFADLSLTYDEERRVASESVHAGAIGHSYTYEERSEVPSSSSSSGSGYVLPDTNIWARRTVETISDGTSKTVYCNGVGQVMLMVMTDGATSWSEAYRYDATGQLILKATPAAVESYDEDDAFLFTLRPFAGLVYHFRSEVPDPNPDSITKINVRELSEGESGTRVLLSKHSFQKHYVGAVATEYLFREAIYATNPVAPGTPAPPAVTEYAYEWYAEGGGTGLGGNLAYKQRVTTLPAVAEEENGSGEPNTRVEFFAPNGQLLWLRDERGFISKYTYDDALGVPLQTIRDVNSAVPDLPAGWSVLAGDRLNLVTDYEHDSLGRLTQELGPSHAIDLGGSTATSIRQATWTVYRDDLPQQWIGRGYATGSAGSYTYVLVNPVQLLELDWAGRMIGQSSAVRTTGFGRLQPGNTFPQSNWVRWSASLYDNQSRLVARRLYHVIPSSGSGSRGTNYAETTYGYDTGLRQNRVQTPGGTITRTVYLPRGMAKEVWVGTNDTGSGSDNMVQVVENVYDAGASDSNGLLTQTTAFAGADDPRVTVFAYDFRNRRVATDGEIDLYEEYSYDNAGRVVRVDRRDTGAAGNLIGRNETAYDALGRVWQTTRHGVDPATGEVSEQTLRELTWYDPAGQAMKQRSQEGGGFEKLKYDGGGRVVTRCVACDPEPEDYAQAASVTDDIVLEQTAFEYDEAGNTTLQRKLERNHDATGTGSLNSTTARLSFVALYPDALGRMVATADYGTNGGASFTRPDIAPGSSDTCLVSKTGYNERGEQETMTDPLGTVQRQTFDAAGRSVETIENYHASGSGPDINKTTQFGYNLDGKLVALTALNSTTGDQVTQWVYGTTLEDSGVATFELLRAKIYPDSDDTAAPLGDGPDEEYDRVEYRYNRLGELIGLKDQNETVHEYEYDLLGRLLHDKVTALGDGVDDAILRISRDYEVRGLLRQVTSADGIDPEDSAVVNQVTLTYNEFSLLIADAQSHDGIEEEPPIVSYTYGPPDSSESSSSSSSSSSTDGTNSITRLRTITYPNGRVLTYEYGEEGSVDALRGRVHEIQDGEDTLVRYTHRGIKSTVRVEYVEPGIELTYIKQGSEPVGDAGDQYTGLDRFGRIVDVRWLKTGSDPIEDVDRFKYGFDAASNRTYRRNVLGSSAGFDELYAYDGLYQLSALKRGTLNSGGTAIAGTPAWQEEFTYDPTGNWQNYLTKVAGSTDLDQDRTHNQANEISSITSPTSPTAYDAAGNMTTMPKVGDWTTGQTLTWDAWDRLAQVSEGESVIGQYQYDGLTRRVWKQTKELDTPVTRHFYYSQAWQILEENISDQVCAVRQYVWGLRYIDDLVFRTAYQSNIVSEYSTHDQWHVTALINEDGQIIERYVYDAFGTPVFMDSVFSIRPASSFAWEHLFGTYKLDNEAQLYCVRFRYLSYSLGRWISRDPIEENGGFNLYLYVRNNPIAFADFLGLSDCADFSTSIVDGYKQYGRMQMAATALFVIGPANFASHNKNTSATGFKPELVSGGQGGEVWSHLYGHIGTKLGGKSSRSDEELLKDERELERELAKQKAGKKNNCEEKKAEVADDVAARAVADIIKDFLDGKISETRAKARIKETLCAP